MYRIYPCVMRTFFTQNLPLKLRCALYTEPFAFIGGNLHNNTKSAKSNNSQFYATSRNKSRKKVCLALYTTSVHIRQYKWHQSSVMQLVYDHDWKFVAFSRVFRWHSKFHEEFSFRLCKSTIHSLIFWFFEQMQKDLKENFKIVEIFSAAPSWILSHGQQV